MFIYDGCLESLAANCISDQQLIDVACVSLLNEQIVDDDGISFHTVLHVVEWHYPLPCWVDQHSMGTMRFYTKNVLRRDPSHHFFVV